MVLMSGEDHQAASVSGRTSTPITQEQQRQSVPLTFICLIRSFEREYMYRRAGKMIMHACARFSVRVCQGKGAFKPILRQCHLLLFGGLAPPSGIVNKVCVAIYQRTLLSILSLQLILLSLLLLLLLLLVLLFLSLLVVVVLVKQQYLFVT